jgi:hypothetical protein
VSGRRLLAAAAAAGVAACAAHAPHGAVSVLLDSEPGGPDEARMVRAVQDTVSSEGAAGDVWVTHGSAPALAPASSGMGLQCTPSVGSVLLRCSPASFGSEGQTVTVVVSRLGGGYEVTIEQSLLFPGRESAVCGLQRQVINAINAELPGTARPDAQSGCKP